MPIVSQYRQKPDVYDMDFDRWRPIAEKYPIWLREPYFKQWELESQILGYCAVYEEDCGHARQCLHLVPTCSHMRDDESWVDADLCGPRFIRKYIEKGDDYEEKDK